MAESKTKKVKLRIGDIICLVSEMEDGSTFEQLEMVSRIAEDGIGQDAVFKNLTNPQEGDSYGYPDIEIWEDGLIETYIDAGQYYLIARGKNATKKSKSQVGRCISFKG